MSAARDSARDFVDVLLQPARPAIERPQMVRVCVENGLKASRLPSTVEIILPSGVRLVVAPDVDPGALTRIMKVLEPSLSG